LMEKALREYDAVLYGDKRQWLQEHKLTYDKLHDYRRQVNARLALPEEDRPNLQRRRLKSGGRKAKLPKEVEDRIFAWVMDRRGGNPDGFYHVVTVSQLLFTACILSEKQLLEGWLWGFMDRYGLSLRCVTTNKAIDTPLVKAVLEEFRFENRGVLKDTTKHQHTFNMDETCIYYDMTHKRTIAVKGGKTISAHHTKGTTHRVSVVVCVSADGQNVPPLIIYVDPPVQSIDKLRTEKGRAERKIRAEAQSKIEARTITIPVYNKFDEDEIVIDDDEKEAEADKADKENMDEEEAAAAEENEVAAAKKLKKKVDAARRKRYAVKPTETREVVIYTSHNNKGWQVTKLMHAWIDEVFMRHTVPDAQGFRYLFMDNMGAHDQAGVLAHCERLGIKVSLLPPNYSPLLQPLDHSLNAVIKYVYRLLFGEFMMRDIEPLIVPAVSPDAAKEKAKRRTRPRKRKVTELTGSEGKGEGKEEAPPPRAKRAKVEEADHRLRASTREEVGTRVAAAVYALSSQHIQHCWHHTLNGETQMKEAEEGHARREREGTQVAIPKTKKRKKREAGEREGGGSAEGGVGEETRVKEEEMSKSMEPVEDDLQVVVAVQEESRSGHGVPSMVWEGMEVQVTVRSHVVL
jgi:hypothetical protein